MSSRNRTVSHQAHMLSYRHCICCFHRLGGSREMTSRNALGGKMRLGAIIFAGLLIAPGATMAGGVRMRSALNATSADRAAKGQVGLGIRGSDGTFDLKASHL